MQPYEPGALHSNHATTPPHPIPPSCSTQSLYVDMRQRVDMHVAVEEIGMRSTRWSTVSHGVRYTTLPDGSMGLEATPK